MNKKTSKTCQSCGCSIEGRKKCSEVCRKKKNKHDFRDRIMALLEQRDKGKTICPSELLPLEEKTDSQKMELVRRSARLLAHEGLIEITQSNKVVDPDHFRGPIRLRLKR